MLSFSSKIIGAWRHTWRITLDHARVRKWCVFSFPLWIYYFLLLFFLLSTCLRVCSWVFQSLSTCISVVCCFLCWVCLISLVFIAWFFRTSFLVSSSDKLAALNCRFSDFISISLNISYRYEWPCFNVLAKLSTFFKQLCMQATPRNDFEFEDLSEMLLLFCH